MTGFGFPGFLAMSANDEAFFVSFLLSLVPTTFHSSGEEAPELLLKAPELLLKAPELLLRGFVPIGEGDLSELTELT